MVLDEERTIVPAIEVRATFRHQPKLRLAVVSLVWSSQLINIHHLPAQRHFYALKLHASTPG